VPLITDVHEPIEAAFDALVTCRERRKTIRPIDVHPGSARGV